MSFDDQLIFFEKAPYLQLIPFTKQPVADLWDLNLWMFRTFQTRFNEMIGDINE